MTAIIEEFFNLTRNSVNHGSILGIEITNGRKKIIYADGITFIKDEQAAKKVALKKFKMD